VTDYTPTTEEIKTVYSRAHCSRKEMFDRWLAEVKAQAWQDGWYAKDTDVNPYRQEEEQ
jgi:hypothetical protein